MICQWESFLSVLPLWLRRQVSGAGEQSLRELRLRINAPPELNLGIKRLFLDRKITGEDLLFCVNTASRYSPWANPSVCEGYLTLPGGHRIGLCGEAVIKNGTFSGFREIHSVNIRIARDFPGISHGFCPDGSVLILGAPGWGKTTLLRDLARNAAEKETVSVIDERGELFPNGFPPGRHMDVLTGCPKETGIPMLLRTMGPAWIALDEITAQRDTDALVQAAGCGVKLMATAHAASVKDLRRRSVYQLLWEQDLFETYLVLKPDQSFSLERKTLCATNGSVPH